MRVLKNRSIITILTIAAMTISTLALAGCSDAETTEPTGDAPITSNWRFVSVTGDDGEVYERLPWEGDDDVPSFACDGTSFEISTVPGSVHSGTVEANEDGTYTMVNDSSEAEVLITIEGNILVIHFPEGRELTFEAAD